MSITESTKLPTGYRYLGATQSLCPECLKLVPAKIIDRQGRVYFRKRCPEHGLREDFICSDVRWYDRYDYALPAKVPSTTRSPIDKGCPFDCGLCEEHEQHTCIGVLEITDNCNLECPLCYAHSRPGLKHRSVEQVRAAIDALVASEGRAEVLQISGGEPTTHPELESILDYALSRPIDYVMINTNGIRLARDPKLMQRLAQHRDRIEIYLQMDGLEDRVHVALRGEPLQATKIAALQAIGEAGLTVTIVSALQAGVNLDQVGPLLELAAQHPFITGLSLQPATYSGRFYLPEELESRVTAPDCIRALCEQSSGSFREEDFFPLPCAHPNCHILSLAFRHQGRLVPLTRFIDAKVNLDLLANGLSFTRDEGQRLIQLYLARNQCCGPGGCGGDSDPTPVLSLGGKAGNGGANASPSVADEFIAKALERQLGAKELFRITITSFLDAYNFDVRRVMKCCTHHVLPTGHIIPFCAYNVLYRDGHVPLPRLDAPKQRSPRRSELRRSEPASQQHRG
ncbi:MAG: radical SAM protein [Planctomycetota bacterium]